LKRRLFSALELKGCRSERVDISERMKLWPNSAAGVSR